MVKLEDGAQEIEKKMRRAAVPEPARQSFLHAVRRVRSGDTGLMPENSIAPIESLARLEELKESPAEPQLLQELAVIKLNGGLGTSMGLDRAKSLIPVKGAETFLDFIARQILQLRREAKGLGPAFSLMDSFSTQRDTLSYLSKYPALAEGGRLDFLQSKVPKIDPTTLAPVCWPQEPELEWCPPGHGDIYPALLGSGLLEELRQRGVKYLFVSNADNLGATIDLALARFFAQSGWSFLMEVAERTACDRKGGHLARKRSDGRLMLRESAQCPKEDEPHFQDIERHRYFNTNNLWIRLEHLKKEMEKHNGTLPLPLIKNVKTVDPRNLNSPKVLQLESAMGAAIECFEASGAVVVPRTRFSPVKTTSDLLALRSDAFRVTTDFRLVLQEARQGVPPWIELDASYYKLLPDFEPMFAEGPPSLLECEFLKVSGRVKFPAGVVCQGKVEFVNRAAETKVVAAGTYRDQRVEL